MTPHVAARKMIVWLEHPGCQVLRAVAGTPVKLTATPGGVRGRAPLLGEHTRPILAELGYTAAEVGRLAESGVILAAE